MAKLELVGKVRAKVMNTGAELGARVASRALDALEKIDRSKAIDRVKARVEKVPVIGKRFAKAAEPALTERELAEDREQAAEAEVKEIPFAADVKPNPHIELAPVAKHPEYFKGRKTTTSKGRKTIPLAAAKTVRAKAQPAGFKAKRGQKQKH